VWNLQYTQLSKFLTTLQVGKCKFYANINFSFFQYRK